MVVALVGRLHNQPLLSNLEKEIEGSRSGSVRRVGDEAKNPNLSVMWKMLKGDFAA
jgi:hypothetical protein